MIDSSKDPIAKVLSTLDVSFHALALPDLFSLSLNIGINATVSAPLDSAKNTKSGILNAAKYASLPKSLKFSELISEVRRSPRSVDASANPARRSAAELIDSLLFDLRNIFATIYQYTEMPEKIEEK